MHGSGGALSLNWETFWRKFSCTIVQCLWCVANILVLNVLWFEFFKIPIYCKMSDNYTELRNQTNFVLGILSSTLIPIVLVGNLLVIISLVKFKFRFRNVTNLFIGSLSSADCLVAVLTLPMYVAFYFDGERLARNKFLCLSKYSSVVCSMSASLTSLVAIAVDRYIAIIHPLKYTVLMTRKRAFWIIFFLWLYNVS